MTQKVRVGIAGTSWWTDLMFLPALTTHPHATVAAICGRNRDRAGELARKYGILGVFTDYHDMIERGGLDALVVAVPDDLHHEITMTALDAGLHVLCEKPLAMTEQQAWDMVQRAEAARVKTMVLFTYRWMPFLRYLRELLDQGYVGRLHQCEFRWLSNLGRDDPMNWRFDRRRANGILGDLGSHLIDMALWLAGDISRVSARLGVFIDRPVQAGQDFEPANDTSHLLVEFDNGAHGLIHASTGPPIGDRWMQQQVNLYGSAGTLEINAIYGGPEAGVVVRGARSEDEHFQVLPVPAAFWGDAIWSDPFGFFATQPVGSRSFIDAIVEDRPVTPNFYDGYKVQQVIEAAIASNESGCSVTIAASPTL